MSWQNENQIGSRKYQCGFCGNLVATDKGFYAKDGGLKIYICPHCNRPSFFERTDQVPGIAPGADVTHLPKELEAIYNEARRCVSVNAHTSAVLSCRKLLMHIAVQQKAEPGKSFVHYVEYLANNEYVPPNGKAGSITFERKGMKPHMRSCL